MLGIAGFLQPVLIGLFHFTGCLGAKVSARAVWRQWNIKEILISTF